MGGGTGTGAAPVIAQTAREMGILTVGIVTIPFSFEGRRRKLQADEGLAALRDNVDTLLIICNDKLREMHGNLKMSEAFSKADDILTVAAKGIAEIITVAGYINVDFEDVKTVMKDGGTAIMGSAAAEGDSRAVKAVSHALSSPLLNDNDISGANYILLNITSGEEEVTMDEIDEITDYIQNEAGNTADIIWGNGLDESLGSKLAVTIIATGFGNTEPGGFTVQKEPKKIVRPLGEDVPTDITQAPASSQAETPKRNEEEPKANEPYLKSSESVDKADQRTIEFDLGSSVAKQENPLEKEPQKTRRFNLDDELEGDSKELPSDREISQSSNVAPEPIQEESGEVRKMNEEEQIRKSQERIDKLKSLGNLIKKPGGINELEKEPAYKRRNIRLEDTPHSSESNVSRYTLGEDQENKTTLKQNNSFLHDNVD